MKSSPLRLTVADLACVKGDRLLFRDLGFSLAAGEGLQLMGPNGVGKTSLLRIIAGLARPESGKVEIRGIDQDGAAPIDWFGIRDGLKNALTAIEHVGFWAGLSGLARPSRAACESLLARFGLARQIDLPASVLSSGQRRRLSLARLELQAKPILLLDEPLNALDADGQILLRDWLEARLAAGAIAIVATHQPIGVAALSELNLGPPQAA
jgi:heme exporter protein A